MGSKAVTGIGSASVIHQMAINVTTAAVRHPGIPSDSGAGKISIRTNTTVPAAKPIQFVFPYRDFSAFGSGLGLEDCISPFLRFTEKTAKHTDLPSDCHIQTVTVSARP